MLLLQQRCDCPIFAMGSVANEKFSTITRCQAVYDYPLDGRRVDAMTDLYGLNDYPARDSIQYGSIAVRVILIAMGGWIASKGFGWLLTKLGWDQPR